MKSPLSDGSIDIRKSSPKLPHFFPAKAGKSPYFPREREVGFLRKECYNMPKMSLLWLN